MTREREKIPVRRNERQLKEEKQLAIVIDHAFLSNGDAVCFRCGRSRREHVA